MSRLGWIVGNGDGTKWRTWNALGPAWTAKKEEATRYHRREDAEAVHAEDADAWRVVEYEPDDEPADPTSVAGEPDVSLPEIPRVTEPDEGKVHYVGPAIIGNVTLCGITDFYGHKKPGKPTRAKATCNGCIGIVAFVRAHKEPRP